MHITTKFPFEPDFVVAPGETIKETLEYSDISIKKFADKLFLSEETVEEILSGNYIITEDLANKIEEITNIPAKMLMNLENYYRKNKSKTK